MHKKIIRSFLITFMFSFVIGYGILYGVLYQVFLQEQKNVQFQDIELIQSMNESDYEQLGKYLASKDTRLTIISVDGQVRFDNMKSNIQENHIERQEVQEAIEHKKSSVIRHSNTIGDDLLYTAIYDKNEDVIIRLSTQFKGISQSAIVLVPAFFVSFLVALLIVWLLSRQMTKSIIQPLKDISTTIRNTDIGKEEICFHAYEYPELKEITDSLCSMSQEITSNYDQLEKERVVREEFFTNASHELKTPLTSIRGYSELLRAHAISDPEQVDRCLDSVLQESDHMIRLIGDILTISKLETQLENVPMQHMDLYDICHHVVDSLDIQAKEHEITLQVLCKHIPIYANRTHIEAILNNLITNAIKYNRKKGYVRLYVEEDQGWVICTVSDTGIGISKENQERIFQRFYRVDKQRSKKIAGTGLGLSIVKHIVQFYEGTISVHSKEDVGTKITIRLPIVVNEQPEN